MPESPSILIRVKAVPGASCDSIAGVLGDRLKLRISAPPEDGKANKSICKLLAKALSLKPSQVEIENGHTNPEKTIRIVGRTQADLSVLLNLDANLIILQSP